MKIAAIIAEYNPFHNGHLYLSDTARKQTGADFVLALMSGDFVQRGAPAVCNKYLRTKMALLSGIDAVIELPTLYALSSASFFACGGVSLLNQLGCIDTLVFGSESGDLTLFQEEARRLCAPSSTTEAQIHALLKEGLSYPAAAAKAANTLGAHEFSSPNDILGLEYCKALCTLGSTISPYTIRRLGSNYHSGTLHTDSSCFGSARAIRNALAEAFPASQISAHMPPEAFQILKEDNLSATGMTADDFSSQLHYKLLSMKSQGFSGYFDCSTDLSHKIISYLPEFTTISAFCELLKSRDLTYTRISRVLFHILLEITVPKWYPEFPKTHAVYAPYARLLGFRKSASPLLSRLKKDSSIPLISKLADASSYLDKEAYALLLQDIFCADIYEAARFHKTGLSPVNEYRQSPIVIS